MPRLLIGNIKGTKGDTGAQGERGLAGTIEVGSVQTVSYGSAASVTNSGTDTEAILDFQIPQGAPGATVTDMSNLVLSSITDTTADYPAFAVGETGSTIFGKIRKFLSDLKEKFVSKSMMTASTNVDTEGQYVADAKAINSLNTSLANTNQSIANLKDGTDKFDIVGMTPMSSSFSVATATATMYVGTGGNIAATSAAVGNNALMQSQVYITDKYGAMSSRYRTRTSESDEWGSWSSYGYFYPMRHKDISGTTDANGFVSLDLDPDITLPILASTRKGGGSLSDRYVEFTPGTTSWYGRVTYRGSAVASTAVKFRVWYFDSEQALV